MTFQTPLQTAKSATAYGWRPYLRSTGPVVVYGLIALNFALNFARIGRYFLNSAEFISGQAAAPYQYRILTAPILDFLIRLFSNLDIHALAEKAPAFIQTPEQLAYFTINASTYFIALGTFHLILRDQFRTPAVTLWGMALFVLTSYAYFLLNPNLGFILPYDIPALAFIEICTFLVMRSRWIILLPVFALATLNRETTFMIVIFVGFRWLLGMDNRRNIIVIGMLAAIWLAIKLILFLVVPISPEYAGGSGVFLLKLEYNVVTLLKPWQWPALFPLFAPVPLAWLVLRQQKTRDAMVWAGTYLCGFAIFFLVAQITEHRAFGDLIGFGVLASLSYLKDRGFLPGQSAVEPEFSITGGSTPADRT